MKCYNKLGRHGRNSAAYRLLFIALIALLPAIVQASPAPPTYTKRLAAAASSTARPKIPTFDCHGAPDDPCKIANVSSLYGYAFSLPWLCAIIFLTYIALKTPFAKEVKMVDFEPEPLVPGSCFPLLAVTLAYPSLALWDFFWSTNRAFYGDKSAINDEYATLIASGTVMTLYMICAFIIACCWVWKVCSMGREAHYFNKFGLKEAKNLDEARRVARNVFSSLPALARKPTAILLAYQLAFFIALSIILSNYAAPVIAPTIDRSIFSHLPTAYPQRPGNPTIFHTMWYWYEKCIDPLFKYNPDGIMVDGKLYRFQTVISWHFLRQMGRIGEMIVESVVGCLLFFVTTKCLFVFIELLETVIKKMMNQLRASGCLQYFNIIPSIDDLHLVFRIILKPIRWILKWTLYSVLFIVMTAIGSIISFFAVIPSWDIFFDIPLRIFISIFCAPPKYLEPFTSLGILPYSGARAYDWSQLLVGGIGFFAVLIMMSRASPEFGRRTGVVRVVRAVRGVLGGKN